MVTEVLLRLNMVLQVKAIWKKISMKFRTEEEELLAGSLS